MSPSICKYVSPKVYVYELSSELLISPSHIRELDGGSSITHGNSPMIKKNQYYLGVHLLSRRIHVTIHVLRCDADLTTCSERSLEARHSPPPSAWVCCCTDSEKLIYQWLLVMAVHMYMSISGGMERHMVQWALSVCSSILSESITWGKKETNQWCNSAVSTFTCP